MMYNNKLTTEKHQDTLFTHELSMSNNYYNI